MSAARLPVLLRGRHGVGKSQVVYQLAAKMGLPVVERRASQMTEGDLVGLPSVEGNRTTFNPPDWFKEACEEPVCLFLDEVDRATLEVRQGIFELTDSRKLNGHRLHPDTVVFAAINGGEHGEQYQVNEMDPAELDRWSVWDIEPTVEDWLAWGKENVDNLIWDFINQNRAHLEHTGEIEPNKRYPSRRSWKRLNDVLLAAESMDASPSLFNLSQSFVGFEAAVALNDFAQNYERVVTVDQLFNGERKEALKAFSLNEHCAMVEKLESEERCKEDLTEEEISNLAEYFVTLPSEAAMKLWSVLSTAGIQENVVKFHQANNGEVGAHLSKILGA
ncbi:MAG: MoxR family ATPase [Porticoccaceae bacterium]|nr:MoxR family ATPase [Porticoccaceae bacterium]